MELSQNVQKANILNILTTPHSVLDSNFSSKHDDEDTLHLDQIINDDYKFNENPQDLRYKSEILLKLKYIIRKWVCSLMDSMKIDECEKNNQKAKIFKGELLPFGSYKLQCFTKDSDIDTVCVVPSFIKRDEHFFGILFDTLSQNENVSDLIAIKETTVPLIKMKFYEVQIDILFAQLNTMFLEKTAEEIINSEQIFGLIDDEKALTSINGIRTCSAILNAVPNVKHFQSTLKYVKLWAKTKGIYSNVMGYLGGISWAILVAKICQLYPNYKPSKLFERFFMIYNRWEWDELSIKIEEINEELKIKYRQKLNFLKEERGENAEKYCMNILTPCFPVKNSSYTVSEMTLKVIKFHIEETVVILSKIKQGMLDWKNLFEKYNFFQKYTKFIKINVFETIPNIEQLTEKSSPRKTENEEFLKWRGIVESKLRKLSKLLETNIINSFLDICLFPTAFPAFEKSFKNSIVYYYGLRIRSNVVENNEKTNFIDFRPIIYWFIENLERGETIPQKMSLEITLVKYSKISKKHIRELENHCFFSNKILKNQTKNEKNHLIYGKDYFKKLFYTDKMMNDVGESNVQNSIFSFRKKLKYIF